MLDDPEMIDEGEVRQKARERIDEEVRRRWIAQVPSAGFPSPQLGVQWLNPSTFQNEHPILSLAQIYLLVEQGVEEGWIEWYSMFTGREKAELTDLPEWLKSQTILSSPDPLDPLFAFLSDQKIRSEREHLFKSFHDGQTSSSLKFSDFNRRLLQNRRFAETEQTEDLISRFLLFAFRRAHPTPLVHSIVRRISESDRSNLYREGWITRVGIYTSKTYPQGKSTIAETRFYLTPKVWEERADTLWNTFHLHQCHLCTSTDVNSKKDLVRQMETTWRDVTHE